MQQVRKCCEPLSLLGRCVDFAAADLQHARAFQMDVRAEAPSARPVAGRFVQVAAPQTVRSRAVAVVQSRHDGLLRCDSLLLLWEKPQPSTPLCLGSHGDCRYDRQHSPGAADRRSMQHEHDLIMFPETARGALRAMPWSRAKLGYAPSHRHRR